ncbi:MAG: sigma-70 family RNA polymerase sigma factor [Candidatus Obscuribacterales bacterium]|nr:sigma-70 family RNA polymerase sigma factor [Candidatus Obscuribacterales bacterium]
MPGFINGLCGTLFMETLSSKSSMLQMGAELLPLKHLEDLDDDELVSLTLSGQKKAFEGLVRRYQKLVYNVLFQMLQSHESAADLTQESFLKAYKNLGSFRRTARLKPWLLKIASNTALNYIRDAKGRYFDSLEELLEDSPQNEPASKECVEEEVDLRFSQARLSAALQKLSPRQRQIFVLRYQHDLPYADISQIIDESESAVKSILFRIREKLRKILIQEERVTD